MNTMVKPARITFYLFAVILVACKSDDPSATEGFLNKISGDWKPSAQGVTLDDEFVNGVFDNFTLTVTKSMDYSTTDGQDPIWKPSGKFTVAEADNAAGFRIIRDDGVEIIVQELTESKLVLQFPFTKEGGRSKGVSGGYVFDLVSN